MQKKNSTLKIILISFLLILLLFTTSNAATVEITKENLAEAFQKFVDSSTNNNNYKMEVGEEIINISSDDGAYEMKYDLTSGPSFSIEMDIKQGMTYDEFEEEQAKMAVPMLGYIAVANINGVDFEDSSVYFLMSFLENVMSNSALESSEYIIYDDREVSSGTEVEVDSEGRKVIKASEFGNYAMEYVNSTYSKPISVDDSSNLNTYKYDIVQQDVTDTSCKIVVTLTIKGDADFSKLIGYADSIENPGEGDQNGEEQEEQEKPQEETQTPPTDTQSKEDNTKSNTPLPKAGTSITIYISLAIMAMLIIIFGIKYIRLKDVK